MCYTKQVLNFFFLKKNTHADGKKGNNLLEFLSEKNKKLSQKVRRKEERDNLVKGQPESCKILMISDRCSSESSLGNSTRKVTFKSPLFPSSLAIGMPCSGISFS